MRTDHAIRHLMKRPHSFVFIGLLAVLATLLASEFLATSSAQRHEKSLREALSTTQANSGAFRMPTEPVNEDMQRFLSRAHSRFPLSAPLVPPVVAESINTYLADCTTLEVHFNQGDTVCAKVTNFSPFDRAIYWVNPDGAVVQRDTVSAGSPTSSRVVNQAGRWGAYLVGFDSEKRDAAFFSVSAPQPSVDLSVFKDGGSSNFIAGGVVSYKVIATNNGPDAATTVTLTEATPNDTTLTGTPAQDSGPAFTCVAGSPTVCTIDTFAAGATASFTFFYQINGGTPVGTSISNTVTLTSNTTELHPEDNTWTDSHVISGTGGTAGCSVACPEDITTTANTTDQSNNPGAVVHFTPPAGSTECGTITVDHCNDCFFPVGTTTVTGSAPTGESCSFNVIVTPPNPGGPTISCPANQTANADSNCSATLTVGSPTVTGNNVTFSGVRSDGKPMYNCDCFPNPDDACDIHGACTRKTDAPFSAGVTTIVWTAYSHDIAGPYPDAATEEAHRTGDVSCVQTITVNDVTPPVIAATDQTVSADANCQAAVPDYSNTVTDNCACASSDTSDSCAGHSRIAVTQDPAPGTLVGLGPHTIHITANDGSSNNSGAGNTSTKDITFTVNDTTPPTFTFVPPSITAYTGAGATTCDTVVDPGAATATDNCGSVTITRSPSGNTFPVGTTTITWTAKDGANNTSTATQTVTVIDNTPPVISCPANITVYLPLHTTATSMPVSYPPATATDNCPGTTIGYTIASGSTFSVGTTPVTATATDASGNSSSCTFTITVLYDFTGFFPPVGNPPTLNVVKAGSAVPVKFSLSGNKGLNIFAVNSPQSGLIPCDSSAPAVDLTDTVTAGGSSLSYDAGSDQYIYVWKTDSSWAGTCRQLVVTLNDGSVHVANFKFK